MEGFLDMNSFQNYPLEESLKQAMIDHEIAFKKQGNLQELHRLYAVQKSMMKYTSPERHLVGSTRFALDDSFVQEDQDFFSRFQQKRLDLRLSTGNSSEDGELDSVEVNLSLSIGRSTTNKRSRSSGNIRKNKIVYPSSVDVIDLEDSNETGSNDFKQTRVVDLDLNKDQHDDDSSFHSNGESCNQIGKPIKVSTSIPTPKGQTEPFSIDLESLPEPTSDLSDEKEIDEKGKEDYSDYIIRKAALSLISISLQETSTRNQDSESEIENKKKKMIPQSSIDSYESLVLKLEESSIEEDSATSKGFEINDFYEKENGIKLRRGRRMKDFQKDILPTLSSLTRDEIWEDINILEGVIRSREYKRMQKAKNGKGEKWFTPVRNKRSKVSYVGGRCCLRKKKPKLC